MKAQRKFRDLAAAWLVLRELECPLVWLKQVPQGLEPGTDLTHTEVAGLVASIQERLEGLRPRPEGLRHGA